MPRDKDFTAAGHVGLEIDRQRAAPLWKFSHLLVAPLLALLTVAVSASDPAELARNGTVVCQPTLRYFCRNIHVGCSGRSNIATFAFVVTIENKRAWLQQAADESKARSGPIEWAEDYAIIWLHPTSDYVKITADGTYSYRHYSRGTAYMSYGTCR